MGKWKKIEKEIEENIWNVPNFFTLIRVILALVLMFLIVANFDLTLIVIIFIIAASTDFIDGQIARLFNLRTEFGRKFDIFADRFLWISFVLVFVGYYGFHGLLTRRYFLSFIIIMTREIVSLPYAIFSLLKKKHIPQVNYFGKTTTFMQGITIPIIILSIEFPSWFDFAFNLSVLTGIVGFISAVTFIKAVREQNKKNERTRTRKD